PRDCNLHQPCSFPTRRSSDLGRRPRTIRTFLSVLPHAFQRHASEGLDATYHFQFTGEEPAEATVVIRGKTIRVEPGHVGTADLRDRKSTRLNSSHVKISYAVF